MVVVRKIIMKLREIEYHLGVLPKFTGSFISLNNFGGIPWAVLGLGSNTAVRSRVYVLRKGFTFCINLRLADIGGGFSRPLARFFRPLFVVSRFIFCQECSTSAR